MEWLHSDFGPVRSRSAGVLASCRGRPAAKLEDIMAARTNNLYPADFRIPLQASS
jgi:hypothetical protein